jgi:hypothetical protein
LVRIAFGLSRFQGNLGLYSASRAGEQFAFKHGLLLTPKSIGPNLMAGMFSLNGFRFFLNLQSAPLTEHQGSRLMHHPKKYGYKTLDDRGRQVLSHWVLFDW